MSKKWSTAGLAFLVALLGSTVVFAAGGVPGPSGTFTACYDRAGDLRLVPDGTTRCPKGWRGPVFWNQEGPQGEQGEQGPPGQPGIPYGGYAQVDQPDNEAIPVTGNSNNGEMTTILQVNNLPWGTYFGIASWEFVTDSQSDVGVNCAVGNQQGHKLLVPGGSGHTTRDASLTLSGMVDNGDGMWLTCQIVGWAGQWDDPPAPPPFVGMSRGSLEAIAVSLDEPSGAPTFGVNISTGEDGQGQYIVGNGWEGPVTVTVDGVEVLTDEPINNDGSFMFWPPDNFDITFSPGNHVVVGDGTNEKDLYVADLSVTEIDGASGWVAGACEMGMAVMLEYSDYQGDAPWAECIDSAFAGHFFDANELPNGGSFVEARQFDNDGDLTQVDAWYPAY